MNSFSISRRLLTFASVVLLSIAAPLSAWGFVTNYDVPAARSKHLIASTLYRSIGIFRPADFYVTDLASDRAGNIITVDYFHKTIVKRDRSGAVIFSIFDQDVKGWPRRLAIDEQDNIYVLYDGTNTLVKYNANGVRVLTVHIDWKYGKTQGVGARNGLLFVASPYIGDMPRIYDAESGELLGEFPEPTGASPGFRRPGGIAALDSGEVLILDQGTFRIERFSSTLQHLGGIQLPRGDGWGQVGRASAFTVDHEQSVYVSDRVRSMIHMFRSDGSHEASWGSKGKGPGQFDQQLGVHFSPFDESLWVAGFHNHDIQKFSRSGELLERWIGHESGPGEFAYIEGVGVTDHFIYLADSYNQRVQVFNRGNGDFAFAFGQRGDIATSDDMEWPQGITINSDGDVFVSEYRRVKHFDSSGHFKTFFPYRPPHSGKGEDIKGARGIALSRDGLLFISDRANNEIDIRSASTGSSLAVWPGANSDVLRHPSGVGFADSVRLLFVTSRDNSMVYAFDVEGQQQRGWRTPARPAGLAVDDRRKVVYVGSRNRIFAYDYSGALLHSWDARNPSQRTLSGVTFEHLHVDNRGHLYATDLLGTVNIYK